MPKASKKKAVHASLRQGSAGKKPRLDPKNAANSATSNVTLKQVGTTKASKLSDARSAAESLRLQADVLSRLWTFIESCKSADPSTNHSANLLGLQTGKIAQKFGEEALKCLIEAMMGNQSATIERSADVLHHLIVLWVHAGIQPTAVWLELEKRETASKLVGGGSSPGKRLFKGSELGTSKIP